MFNKKDLDITVTCASGTEKILKTALNRLGYGEVPVVNGKAHVLGSGQDVARLNLFLRTADRVYITLKEFSATSFDELFDGVYAIPWETFIPKDACVLVDGKCVKSTIYAISASQSIIKKAIAKRLCERYKLSSLPETGSKYQIDFSIFKDTVSIMLNTSGVGLHKRGYREKVWIAPIKETLASSLLLYSDFYHEKPLIDPFCGSGTIIIEGALTALNIAPGIFRKFAFSDWKNFDKKFYAKAFEEAKDGEVRDRKLDFSGFDIDPKAIDLARLHAKRAGVFDKVKFSARSVDRLVLPKGKGTIVTNPPYGERVYDKKEAEACYKTLGEKLKENKEFSAFIITSAKNFEKCFGKRADRVKKLYNSEKECGYYFYYGKKEQNND